jgi:hypothetical protein
MEEPTGMGGHDGNDIFFHRAAIAHDAVRKQLYEYVSDDIDRVRHLIALLSASLVVQQFYMDPLEADALMMETEERVAQMEGAESRPSIRLARWLMDRLREFDESLPDSDDWD